MVPCQREGAGRVPARAGACLVSGDASHPSPRPGRRPRPTAPPCTRRRCGIWRVLPPPRRGWCACWIGGSRAGCGPPARSHAAAAAPPMPRRGRWRARSPQRAWWTTPPSPPRGPGGCTAPADRAAPSRRISPPRASTPAVAGAASARGRGRARLAALAYARRRRHRPVPDRHQPTRRCRLRELAALARAGFPREVAERALRTDEAAAEALLLARPAAG